MSEKIMSTSDVIKEIRQKHNLTQEELGNILGVKKSAVQKYEDGTIKNLKLDTIRTLCETFQVSPWRIVFPDKTGEWIVNLVGQKESQKELLEIAIKKEYSEKVYSLLQLFWLLNTNGKDKVIDYMKDLLKIKTYQNHK